MTQQKSKKSDNKLTIEQNTELKKSGIDLRKEYANLPVQDQQAISHFFNLHNAAEFMYSSLSSPAKEYVEICINLAQEKK